MRVVNSKLIDLSFSVFRPRTSLLERSLLTKAIPKSLGVREDTPLTLRPRSKL